MTHRERLVLYERNMRIARERRDAAELAARVAYWVAVRSAIAVYRGEA